MEKKEPSYTVGGNVNRYSHYENSMEGFPKKPKIELPYDLAIPLLGIYPEEKENTYIHICLCVFVCVYIYVHTYIHTHMHTIEYYSAIRTTEIMPFAAMWMDPERILCLVK